MNYHNCTSYEGHMVDLTDVNFEIFSIQTQGSYQQNNSGIAPKNCATSQKQNKQKNSPGKMMLFQDDHNHQESPLEALGMQVSGMSWNGNQQVRD